MNIKLLQNYKGHPPNTVIKVTKAEADRLLAFEVLPDPKPKAKSKAKTKSEPIALREQSDKPTKEKTNES